MADGGRIPKAGRGPAAATGAQALSAETVPSSARTGLGGGEDTACGGQARPARGVPVVHLQINEGMFTGRPVLICTVLGSCVSVTFHHRPSGLSGMFHAALPSRQGISGAARSSGACRFVDSAIETILGRFRARGIGVGEIEAKLFGGAFAMQQTQITEKVRATVDVGARNVERAKAVLAEVGLPILAEDTLGGMGRRLFFHTRTGEVWMAYLRKMDMAPQQ